MSRTSKTEKNNNRISDTKENTKVSSCASGVLAL